MRGGRGELRKTRAAYRQLGGGRAHRLGVGPCPPGRARSGPASRMRSGRPRARPGGAAGRAAGGPRSPPRRPCPGAPPRAGPRPPGSASARSRGRAGPSVPVAAHIPDRGGEVAARSAALARTAMPQVAEQVRSLRRRQPQARLRGRHRLRGPPGRERQAGRQYLRVRIAPVRLDGAGLRLERTDHLMGLVQLAERRPACRPGAAARSRGSPGPARRCPAGPPPGPGPARRPAGPCARRSRRGRAAAAAAAGVMAMTVTGQDGFGAGACPTRCPPPRPATGSGQHQADLGFGPGLVGEFRLREQLLSLGHAPPPPGRCAGGRTTGANAAAASRRWASAPVPPGSDWASSSASASRPAAVRASTAVTIRGNRSWSAGSVRASVLRARSAVVCGAEARNVRAVRSSRCRAAWRDRHARRWPGARPLRSPSHPG